MSRERPIEILLVEDNAADARLTREALRIASVEARLRVACDGDEALGVLRRSRLGLDGPRPDLVLLDLNLPGRSGREVLAEIKADADLAALPVVVLTTSDADDDVAACYALHANAYLVKPVDFTRFADAMASLAAFWLGAATLPAAPARREALP